MYINLQLLKIWSEQLKRDNRVTLPAPSISLHSTNKVTWGGKVDITCFVETQFTGGSFTLIQNSGSFRETKSGTSVTFSLPKVDFVHEGSYYCQYRTRVSSRNFNSPQSSSVNISVEVNLLQPYISFSATDGSFHWGSQVPEVTRGHSFSIICSTKPQYPGVSFHWKLSGSSFTITQLYVNHSTTFFFPEADFIHQGNYSCVYKVTLSSRTFSSPTTELLVVTVKGTKNTYVVTKGKTEMDDDEDYENAETVFYQREDSFDSGEDYVNVNADVENTAVGSDCAGAKTKCGITNTGDETDDDDYENTEVTVQKKDQRQDSHFSDEDYIDIYGEAEKMAVDNDHEDEEIYTTAD
ncbi:hypothetical protein MHYP_G00149670 [Metynnis hypsauchen]